MFHFLDFNKDNWRDGYPVVFGEFVEGENVLSKIEELGSRDGHTKEHVVFEDSGSV